MRFIETPLFETDEQKWEFIESLPGNWTYPDYKVWDTIERIDELLQEYGLEIESYDEPEWPFRIVKRG